jgi:hypothetical protein
LFSFAIETSSLSFFRPWVVIEKQVGLENIKASIGTLLPESEVTYTQIPFVLFSIKE